MYWNHRVMKRVDGEGTNFEEENLYVVEVYYDDDNKLIGWTTEKSVYGENLDEIRQTLEWMLSALDKPILVEKDLLAEAELARENGESDIFSSEAFAPIEPGQVYESVDDLMASLEEEKPTIVGTQPITGSSSGIKPRRNR